MKKVISTSPLSRKENLRIGYRGHEFRIFFNFFPKCKFYCIIKLDGIIVLLTLHEWIHASKKSHLDCAADAIIVINCLSINLHPVKLMGNLIQIDDSSTAICDCELKVEFCIAWHITKSSRLIYKDLPWCNKLHFRSAIRLKYCPTRPITILAHYPSQPVSQIFIFENGNGFVL